MVYTPFEDLANVKTMAMDLMSDLVMHSAICNAIHILVLTSSY